MINIGLRTVECIDVGGLYIEDLGSRGDGVGVTAVSKTESLITPNK